MKLDRGGHSLDLGRRYREPVLLGTVVLYEFPRLEPIAAQVLLLPAHNPMVCFHHAGLAASQQPRLIAANPAPVLGHPVPLRAIMEHCDDGA